LKPSLFNIDLESTFIIVGFSLFGLGTGATVITNIPEILDAVEESNREKGIHIDEYSL